MYAYCLNNPVNYADPFGLVCVCMTRRVGGNNHVCSDIKIVRRSPSGNTVSDKILSMPQFAKYSKSTNNSSGFSKSSVGSSSSGGAIVKSFADGFFGNYASSYADQYIHSFLPAPPKSSIGSSGNWINALDDFSKSLGIVSFVFTIEEILWDIDYYYGDVKKQSIAVSIDIVSVVVSTSVTSALVGVTDGYGIIFSAGISAFVDGCFDLLKDELLG